MFVRRRAAGAEVTAGGAHFRVWAPGRRSVSVVFDDGDEIPLDPEENGYFAGFAKSGLYKFRIDDQNETYPDPASRFQPDGPHGFSAVIDPTAYRWNDAHWRGITRENLVYSEIHIGTFTPAGTYAAAAEKLPLLKDVGINVIELMPLHEFAGTFGWGYDGVDLWAPYHHYGTPDDLRAFVDRAHALGLAVVLDVVYNHFGPDGCYLRQFTPSYFTHEKNEWGDALDFTQKGVREFLADNAAYWIEEFHFDGLRLDATQSITDRSVIGEIVARARAAAGDRGIVISAENEPQEAALIDRWGVDVLWNDDWHHAAQVALTGNREAYYTDYAGTPHEFTAMALHGFLYQGQWYRWQKQRRGTPSLHLDPDRFVCYLQNHDQIANSVAGARIHQLTSPGRSRAMTALLLLQPQTPLLFQGEEFAASTPFLYFADHQPELAKAVAAGRREFLQQFPSIATGEHPLAPPHARETFERCKLDFGERERNRVVVELHRDLLRLRCSESLAGTAVLGPDALLLRWPERLLIVNLGRDLRLDTVPEPLLAPPAGRQWKLVLSTNAPAYGGAGTPPPESEGGWRIPAECALLMTSGEDDRDRSDRDHST